MRERAKEGFTLIELLIVLLLMGIVYALAFSYMMPKSEKEAASELTLETIGTFFRSQELYGKAAMTLYCKESGVCTLTGGKEPVSGITLRGIGRAYIVNPDETFQSIDYPHIKIGADEFRPILTIHCRADGLFDPQVARRGDKWYYLHPFGKVYRFTDPVSMVSFMRKSDYLPDRAGYAQ